MTAYLIGTLRTDTCTGSSCYIMSTLTSKGHNVRPITKMRNESNN